MLINRSPRLNVPARRGLHTAISLGYPADEQALRLSANPAGLTSVPPEIIDAAKVDGATFLQRFRMVIVPMIAPILFIGTAFDTVFTLSDLSIVYLLTNGGPDGATEILPTLAYNTGIRGGALGRGAAISLFLFPLLLPAMILLLRTLRRKQY